MSGKKTEKNSERWVQGLFMARASCLRHHNYKKNVYVGGKSVKKMFKKMDSEISCGARKLSRILWLKNTKTKETQLKKY